MSGARGGQLPCALVAQPEELCLVKAEVAGSNPAGRASGVRRACRLCRCALTDALGLPKTGAHGGRDTSHPAQALRDYRRASGIDARLVVVGMVSNGFSIADPSDPGMLDVVGFDTATPQLVSDFARGEV